MKIPLREEEFPFAYRQVLVCLREGGRIAAPTRDGVLSRKTAFLTWPEKSEESKINEDAVRVKIAILREMEDVGLVEERLSGSSNISWVLPGTKVEKLASLPSFTPPMLTSPTLRSICGCDICTNFGENT